MIYTNNIGAMMKIYKNKDSGMIFGVCSGLAETTGINLAILRFATIAGTIISGSLVLWIYLILAILLPQKK